MRKRFDDRGGGYCAILDMNNFDHTTGPAATGMIAGIALA
jgi:hypothetical protein